MEEAPVAPEPPFVSNGFVTFASMGNIAKITEPVARAWARVLDAVPDSRLLLRSISFSDPLPLDETRERLRAWGLPIERVDFRPPEGGPALFKSYNDVDIVLDTFPFNGGTTTCFATYMGVPVVTLVGHSLLGRMGLSVMTNLGAPELAVEDLDTYVERAVALARDGEFLRRFKREARGIYESTPLGNGKLFAAEFEQAVIDLLAQQRAGALPWDSRIPALPADELVRRAYAAMRSSQPEAADRILSHCLREYPDAGAAHLLRAQILVWAGNVDQAITYLSEGLPRFAPADQVSARIALVRMHLLLQDRDAVRAGVEALRALPIDDAFDRAQLRLYEACLAPRARTPVEPQDGAA
jgi:hypothetical protein